MIATFSHPGEYNIEKLEVRVTGSNSAVIVVERNMKNSPRYDWFVWVNWLERLRGVTLESKIAKKKAAVIAWMEKENARIREFHAMEKRLSGR